MNEAQMPERYAMHQGFDYDSMQPDPEGGYVSYSDHADIVASLEKEHAAFKSIATQKINNLERAIELLRIERDDLKHHIGTMLVEKLDRSGVWVKPADGQEDE